MPRKSRWFDYFGQSKQSFFVLMSSLCFKINFNKHSNVKIRTAVKEQQFLQIFVILAPFCHIFN